MTDFDNGQDRVGYTVGEDVSIGDYSLCKNTYHINYTAADYLQVS